MNKKCPLKKEIHNKCYDSGMRNFHYSQEEFQDCIGKDCMAWDDNYKLCIYLRGLRFCFITGEEENDVQRSS